MLNDPIEIVRRRYAAGEITREQFDQMRADLRGPEAGRRFSGNLLSNTPWQLSVLIGIAFLVVTAVAAAVVGSALVNDNYGWNFMDRMMSRGMMGYGRSTADSPQTTGRQSESVSMRDYAFTPGNLQVPVGATVTWTNYDDAPHSAVAMDSSWDTGTLNKGQHRSLTFDKAGDYRYYCAIHQGMQARLLVRSE